MRMKKCNHKAVVLRHFDDDGKYLGTTIKYVKGSKADAREFVRSNGHRLALGRRMEMGILSVY